MSSERDELAATARSVFRDHQPHPGEGLPTELWSTLTELGLTQLTLPEAAGGSGGELADAAALLLVAGEAAAPVPLAETDLLAGWLLHAHGLAVPNGPLAVAVGGDTGLTVRAEAAGGVCIAGTLERVGWARDAVNLVLLCPGPDGADLVAAVDPSVSGVSVRPGTNLAGEARDTVLLDVHLAADAVAGAAEDARCLLARRAALSRALLLAGAAGRAFSQTVRYAGERVQFGRPIAKFQAVQQQLALAAAEVAAGRAAAEAAVRIAAVGDFAGADAGFAVAVAKARTSEAAGPIARIAHQVHGAIGFTEEHDLRLCTTRLWAWRDEDGSEAHWHAEIGRQALDAGAEGLWPLLTRASV